MNGGIRRQHVDFEGAKSTAPVPRYASLMHEFGSKQNLLSANMHMAESVILIRELYAGNESANGIESTYKIEMKKRFHVFGNIY